MRSSTFRATHSAHRVRASRRFAVVFDDRYPAVRRERHGARFAQARDATRVLAGAFQAHAPALASANSRGFAAGPPRAVAAVERRLVRPRVVRRELAAASFAPPFDAGVRVLAKELAFEPAQPIVGVFDPFESALLAPVLLDGLRKRPFAKAARVGACGPRGGEGRRRRRNGKVVASQRDRDARSVLDEPSNERRRVREIGEAVQPRVVVRGRRAPRATRFVHGVRCAAVGDEFVEQKVGDDGRRPHF